MILLFGWKRKVWRFRFPDFASKTSEKRGEVSKEDILDYDLRRLDKDQLARLSLGLRPLLYGKKLCKIIQAPRHMEKSGFQKNAQSGPRNNWEKHRI